MRGAVPAAMISPMQYIVRRTAGLPLHGPGPFAAVLIARHAAKGHSADRRHVNKMPHVLTRSDDAHYAGLQEVVVVIHLVSERA
jgi:hypothetical protein